MPVTQKNTKKQRGQSEERERENGQHDSHSAEMSQGEWDRPNAMRKRMNSLPQECWEETSAGEGRLKNLPIVENARDNRGFNEKTPPANNTRGNRGINRKIPPAMVTGRYSADFNLTGKEETIQTFQPRRQGEQSQWPQVSSRGRDFDPKIHEEPIKSA